MAETMPADGTSAQSICSLAALYVTAKLSMGKYVRGGKRPGGNVRKIYPEGE